MIRGATLFSGYWPDGSGGPGADGWFVTGDIGYLDDAGELHLVDRAAEVVKVAGFTVYPREVEEVLATHPYVAEVAVIGVPGADGQEQVVAVIVPKQGTHPTTERPGRVRRPTCCRRSRRPTAYHLVDALPRTEVGRLDRAAVQRSQAKSGPVSRLTAVDSADDTEPAPRTPSCRLPAPATPRMPSRRRTSPRNRSATWTNWAPGCRAPAIGSSAASQDTDEDLF